MYLTEDIVSRLTEKEAKSILRLLIIMLDESDNDDYFGTEGWRHYSSIDEVKLENG